MVPSRNQVPFLWLVSIVCARPGAWDPQQIHEDVTCSVAPIRNGADYFITLNRLLSKATYGTEVILMSWEIDLGVQLLGYEDANGKNVTLLLALVEAADRGAKINAQFWVSRAARMPDHKQTMQARRLRKLGHKNIKVFIDFGRGGTLTPRNCINAMRAVVFDRRLLIVSSTDFNAPSFSNDLYSPMDSLHIKTSEDIKIGEWQYDLSVRRRGDRTFGLKVQGEVANLVAQLAVRRQVSFCENLWRPSQYPGCMTDERLPSKLVVPRYRSPYATEDFLYREQDYCHASISGSYQLLGVDHQTKQITEDYEHIITSSKHYLYIENAYFVSKGINETSILSHIPNNTMMGKVAERVKRAIGACSNFSVVIVLSLMDKNDALHYETWKTLFHPQLGLMPYLETIHMKATCKRSLHDFITISWLGAEHRLNNGDSVFFTVKTHTSIILADDNQLSFGSAEWDDRSFDGFDANLNIYVNQPLKYVRQALFDGFFAANSAMAEQARLACKGQNGADAPSLARVFYEEGRRNNDLTKTYMGLDSENGNDTILHAHFLHDKEAKEFFKGMKWKQRKERAVRQHAHVGVLFNFGHQIV